MKRRKEPGEEELALLNRFALLWVKDEAVRFARGWSLALRNEGGMFVRQRPWGTVAKLIRRGLIQTDHVWSWSRSWHNRWTMRADPLYTISNSGWELIRDPALLAERERLLAVERKLVALSRLGNVDA